MLDSSARQISPRFAAEERGRDSARGAERGRAEVCSRSRSGPRRAVGRDVAARYGVSRQTICTWVHRYETGGLAALADRSHKPASCPNQLAAPTEAAICDLRRCHPTWGQVRIAHELGRDGISPPSLSAIYRTLARNGLLIPGARRRKKSDYQRWERRRPMELWQMDVMGGVALADGTEACH
jgi:transposase